MFEMHFPSSIDAWRFYTEHRAKDPASTLFLVKIEKRDNHAVAFFIE